MTELVYRDRFYISGKACEVVLRLKEHSKKYRTVKELLGDLAPGSEN